MIPKTSIDIFDAAAAAVFSPAAVAVADALAHAIVGPSTQLNDNKMIENIIVIPRPTWLADIPTCCKLIQKWCRNPPNLVPGHPDNHSQSLFHIGALIA